MKTSHQEGRHTVERPRAGCWVGLLFLSLYASAQPSSYHPCACVFREAFPVPLQLPLTDYVCDSSPLNEVGAT